MVFDKRKNQPKTGDLKIRESITKRVGRRIDPEGKLTTDGEVDTFKRGVEMILERTPVPVVPMALGGLWGSFFSHKGGPAFSRLPKRFWSKITLTVGEALPAQEASALILEEKVKALRTHA